LDIHRITASVKEQEGQFYVLSVDWKFADNVTMFNKVINS